MSYLYNLSGLGEKTVPAPAPAPAPIPAPPPALTGPTSIPRGTPADYIVTNVPPGATLSNWRFTTGAATLPRSGNNNVSNWSGTMVQSGRISVNVVAGGNVRALTLDVTVTPRPWTENAQPVPLVRTGHGTLPVQPRLNRPGRDPRDPGLGVSPVTGRRAIRTRIVSGGPNDGFNYLDIPPVTWDTPSFTNNALYDTTHPFFRAHDPMRRGLPLPGGRLQIGTIQKNVEAHEGIISPPHGAPPDYASHQQRLLNFLRANPINRVVERDVSHTSRESNRDYAIRIERFVRTRSDAATAASQPHPRDIFRGAMYFNYPFISPRMLRLRVGGTHQLNLTNPAGKPRWASTNTAFVTVDGRGTVRAVRQGRAIVRVTNADGDTDEITVTVDP